MVSDVFVMANMRNCIQRQKTKRERRERIPKLYHYTVDTLGNYFETHYVWAVYFHYLHISIIITYSCHVQLRNYGYESNVESRSPACVYSLYAWNTRLYYLNQGNILQFPHFELSGGFMCEQVSKDLQVCGYGCSNNKMSQNPIPYIVYYFDKSTTAPVKSSPLCFSFLRVQT